ncbi:hypothetical protein DPX39_040031100 [Trypanosoma brucei equiperdum]|uniref:C2CD3 N-terminal C2 domain-containing protein n=1 Tax=Trypanosoma brucei equiperdum TaxID=630700 RepID=A0A3L6L8R6_9TRYP|nr:hypothetical protein DPX39_040031100 [Trypanosoma brucei equiperdum]
MNLVYGSHLPPGTEGPTCGELRIRVEKMILREDIVNSAVRLECASANARPISVSVDHCAVAPLFRGEARPSAQCTPTTPGKVRGVLSLVYPIKTHEAQFVEYLTNMSKSFNGGVHVLVFVPTSYSGRRKPTHIGKTIVALDRLKPSSPVGGWFHIMRDMSSTDGKTAEKGTSPVTLVDVGKVKLSFTVTYFSQATPTRQRSTSTTASHALQQGGAETSDQSRIEKEKNPPPGAARVSSPTLVGVNILPPQAIKDEQSGEQRPRGERSLGRDDRATPNSTPGPQLMPASQVPLCGSFPRASEVPMGFSTNQKDTISQLLQRGHTLRARMERALDRSALMEGALGATTYTPMLPYANSIERAMALPGVTPGSNLMLGLFPVSAEADTSASSRTSLSDGSVKGTPENSVASGVVEPNETPKESRLHTGVTFGQRSFQRTGALPTEGGYVEVDLSRISFSSGPATLGMEEMRIDIRLSKDVKTDEPVESYSSYVHRVPLAKGPEHHIVIGFQVRSFSEDKSRMVIGFYRVFSAPVSNPPSETLLPAPASAKRVLVNETLLGICIVGLHAQSRDIVAHDPFSGEDPTQAHLCVRVRDSAPAVVDNGPKRKEASRVKRVTVVRSDQRSNGSHSNEKLVETRREGHRVHLKEGPDEPVQWKRECSEDRESCSSSSTSTPSSTGRSKRRHRVGDSSNRAEQTEVYPVQICPTTPVKPTVQNAGEPEKKNFRSILASPQVTGGLHRGKTSTDGPSDRFRMHVAIRSCKDLPLVALRRDGLPMVSTVVPTDQMANGVRSALASDGSLVLIDSEYRVFTPPSTFFTVEDIYNATSSSALSRGVVPDWYVEAAVRGEYDRTLVVPKSQSPQYDYECILSLPHEAVFLRQASAENQRTAIEAAAVREGAAPGFPPSLLPADKTWAAQGAGKETVPCLSEMRLTLWHHAPEVDGVETRAKRSEEEKLWVNAAPLGECRIDLRSLRFLRVIDGWYRINEIDRLDNVVGYVRVSVRML